MTAWQAGGVLLPHFTGDQWADSYHIGASQLQPGDLVFSNGFGHVQMYVGHGEVIQAPYTGQVVSYAPLPPPALVDGYASVFPPSPLAPPGPVGGGARHHRSRGHGRGGQRGRRHSAHGHGRPGQGHGRPHAPHHQPCRHHRPRSHHRPGGHHRPRSHHRTVRRPRPAPGRHKPCGHHRARGHHRVRWPHPVPLGVRIPLSGGNPQGGRTGR